MNQIKIGKFIATKRKEQNLTQAELSEKLGITDRAVSKWETGKSLPDSSIMIELCEVLNISVNELLCGEEIQMEDYNKKTEELLLKMKREKEEKDRQLLKTEIVIGFISVIAFFALIFVAAFIETASPIRIALIVIGAVIFAYGISNAIKIEQTAGYYECQKCRHRYVPEYNSVFWAMHMGRTRYLKCPKCHEKSWNKKVIEEE